MAACVYSIDTMIMYLDEDTMGMFDESDIDRILMDRFCYGIKWMYRSAVRAAAPPESHFLLHAALPPPPTHPPSLAHAPPRSHLHRTSRLPQRRRACRVLPRSATTSCPTITRT